MNRERIPSGVNDTLSLSSEIASLIMSKSVVCEVNGGKDAVVIPERRAQRMGRIARILHNPQKETNHRQQ